MKKVVLFCIMNVFIGYSKGTRLSAYSFLKIKEVNKLSVAVPGRVVFIGWFFLFYYFRDIPAKPSWHLEVAVSTGDYKLETPRAVSGAHTAFHVIPMH